MSQWSWFSCFYTTKLQFASFTYFTKIVVVRNKKNIINDTSRFQTIHVSHASPFLEKLQNSVLISGAGSVWDKHFFIVLWFDWWTLGSYSYYKPSLFLLLGLLFISFLPNFWSSDFFIGEQTSKWEKVEPTSVLFRYFLLSFILATHLGQSVCNILDSSDTKKSSS